MCDGDDLDIVEAFAEDDEKGKTIQDDAAGSVQVRRAKHRVNA